MARNVEGTAKRRAWQNVKDFPNHPELAGSVFVDCGGGWGVLCRDGMRYEAQRTADNSVSRTMSAAAWNRTRKWEEVKVGDYTPTTTRQRRDRGLSLKNVLAKVHNSDGEGWVDPVLEAGLTGREEALLSTAVSTGLAEQDGIWVRLTEAGKKLLGIVGMLLLVGFACLMSDIFLGTSVLEPLLGAAAIPTMLDRRLLSWGLLMEHHSEGEVEFECITYHRVVDQEGMVRGWLGKWAVSPGHSNDTLIVGQVDGEDWCCSRREARRRLRKIKASRQELKE